MVAKIMKMQLFLVYGLLLWLFSGCGNESSPKGGGNLDETMVKKKPMVITKNLAKLNQVNFYFENSASMNGYLDGDNFLLTMNQILGEIDAKELKLKPYFVNTQEHLTDNILNKIENKNTQIGKTGSSDHQFIFKNAIKNATGDTLSIVITDGIYSVDGNKPIIVAKKIEVAFEKALKENEIETAILKLSSNFDGAYYSESCEPGHREIMINQERPYYVILFGNSETINEALKEIVVIDDLDGFKKQARFFITKNKSVNYSILTQGEEKHAGKLEPVNKYSKEEVRSIKGERFSARGFNPTPKKDNYLQFGIAVDYANYSTLESYLTDIKNYEVDGQTGYRIVDVKKISNMDKKSKTYDVLSKQKKKYTHIIIVKATNELYGDLEIILKNNLPGWIKDTGIENDCDIRGNTKQTFAFDQLINGISKAYEEANKNDEYLKLELKINI